MSRLENLYEHNKSNKCILDVLLLQEPMPIFQGDDAEQPTAVLPNSVRAASTLHLTWL